MFAVGSDDSNVTYGGKVQIYEYNENTRYVLQMCCPFYEQNIPPKESMIVKMLSQSMSLRKYSKAETLMTVTDAVHDIAFAPNLGRSFHVLAIATKDVRIFKLVPMR